LSDLTTTKVSKRLSLRTIPISEAEPSLLKPLLPENKDPMVKEKEDPELKVTLTPTVSSLVT